MFSLASKPAQAEKKPPKDLYARQRRYAQRQAREASDIGEIPPVKNPARREACRRDLFRYLTTYFPNSTGLRPFSDDHRLVIEAIQRCVLFGGLFLDAVYRGFAKTTISENGLIWAVTYAHRHFGAIFGADAGAAEANIDSIKLELSENDLLYEDFPEIIHPIRSLEGKPQRCASQTYRGQLTHIEWTADTIVLPHVEGSPASGGIITAKGITAAARGMKHKRPDGTQQRPDFLVIDDPQTDKSASTQHQVGKRLGVIKKSLLKLGGHNRRIAAVMNATVIEPDDLVEQLLDPKRNPAWQGQRIKMVKRWADAHETLWLGDYARLRTTYDRDVVGDQERARRDATLFYDRKRAEMDKGAIVSWEHCYTPGDELSAVQHAYNMLIDDGAEVFASECQNEPLQPNADNELLKPHEIAVKTNGLERGVVPLGCEYLTAFIDVQGDVLFYAVAAWARDFTGAVIDYGTYPEQVTTHYTLASATRRLAGIPGLERAGLEAKIIAGLEKLSDHLLERSWRREGDGAAMKISRMGVDANWGKTTSTVNTFCLRSKHAAIVIPCHGRYVGASSLPWDLYTRKEGELIGFHWMLPSLKGKATVRHVLSDVNFWKSFLHTRLAVPGGDKGSLTLFGPRPRNGEPGPHQMFAEHMHAEYRIKTEGRGRKVDEWKLKPSKPDNHFLDCLVGCATLASMLGCDLNWRAGNTAPPPKARKRAKVKYWN